jgi:hypothetical protein
MPEGSEDWNRLVGRTVEIRQDGRHIRAGEVEDAAKDSSVMWLRFDGNHGRQLIAKSDTAHRRSASGPALHDLRPPGYPARTVVPGSWMSGGPANRPIPSTRTNSAPLPPNSEFRSRRSAISMSTISRQQDPRPDNLAEHDAGRHLPLAVPSFVETTTR